MVSRGFHGVDGGDVGSCAAVAVGGCSAVKDPSSRSLSYTMMVPSAWETRKRVGEDGTQCTAVQGELVIQPCLFMRTYREDMGSVHVRYE